MTGKCVSQGSFCAIFGGCILVPNATHYPVFKERQVLNFKIPFNGTIGGVGGGRYFHGGNGVAEDYEPQSAREIEILKTMPGVKFTHEEIRKQEHQEPQAPAAPQADPPAPKTHGAPEEVRREKIEVLKQKLAKRPYPELVQAAKKQGVMEQHMKKVEIVGALAKKAAVVGPMTTHPQEPEGG